VIRIQDFSYTYPGTLHPALKEINLQSPIGQFCGIVGANGAGKSTLCYALTGFIPHFYHGDIEGHARVAGRDVAETPLGELAGEIGLVFQNPFNQISGARFTVREEVAFGLENLGVPRDEMLARVDLALEQAGLAGYEDRSPFALSGGQQQRLAIASMLVMQPKVLVLDEPTSQLDPVGTKEIFTILRELAMLGDTTVVLTEHKLEWLATFADRVVVVHEGRIVADGSPREVLTSPSIELYGIRQTRYTRAASMAVERAKMPSDRTLPVTLEQAVEFFQ
jgi:energy-coupling factor transport system ATP-binding protein